jgi:hypothetical protein
MNDELQKFEEGAHGFLQHTLCVLSLHNLGI